jgi:aerobic C4-dicarboxylate transport protein
MQAHHKTATHNCIRARERAGIAVVLGLIAKLAGFSLWRFLRYIQDEILSCLAPSRRALQRMKLSTNGSALAKLN